jgi:signal transduction histidine kinase
VGDLVPIIVAIVTSIGTVVAAYFGARKWAGRSKGDGVGDEPDPTAVAWREQAELQQARAELLAEQLREERESHSDDLGILERERRRLADTQHDLDDCSRQRDNAYSRVRQLERERVT